MTISAANVDDAAFYNRETGELETVREMREKAEAKSIDDQIADLAFQIAEMKETLDFVKEHIVKSAATIEKVGAEVMPTLDSLMKSPMLKMLLPKGK
jgi:chemotaxis regulatin CheY-phosphate phosphatase CheZ